VGKQFQDKGAHPPGSRPSSIRVKAFDGAAIIPNIPRALASDFICLGEVRPPTKHFHYFAALFVGTQASRRSNGVHDGHLLSDALPVVHGNAYVQPRSWRPISGPVVLNRIAPTRQQRVRGFLHIVKQNIIKGLHGRMSLMGNHLSSG